MLQSKQWGNQLITQRSKNFWCMFLQINCQLNVNLTFLDVLMVFKGADDTNLVHQGLVYILLKL